MVVRGTAIALALSIAVAAMTVAAPWQGSHAQGGEAVEVDLELVLATDVSTSMDRAEKQLQLAGFVAAFRDGTVIDAIRQGRRGRIAVTYVEWGGEGRERVVLPWTLIEGAAAAHAFADRLAEGSPGRLVYGTAMGEALLFCADLFGSAGYAGDRQVIDLSGDGFSNRGRPLGEARGVILARGITINGLPLVYKDPDDDETAFPPDELVRYFVEEVIGGPGAFVLPVRSVDAFPIAIRQKLIREIAGAPVPGRMAERRP
ncbi:DUF1194 domain-containing protein [Ancylobacter sonchi]|uniref:DUF1194 domain-containing protein n=1 Tax=Ancylobacter sonchi TaxID=1937790 RepID=UPI001BD408DA|nr:DUF1194 domain-containing protein [Ancylobacter sonchi]MBS7536978.1 DUF1194 domain-containing protein [Ancylobacter sonchi]